MSIFRRPILLIAMASSIGLRGASVGAEPAQPDYADDVAPFLATYCVGCHNADDQEGVLSLESFS